MEACFEVVYILIERFTEEFVLRNLWTSTLMRPFLTFPRVSHQLSQGLECTSPSF